MTLSVIAAIHRDTVLSATWEAYLAGVPMTWLVYGEDRQ
jgi:hypothetical protein